MASVAVELALVFTYLNLLRKLTDSTARQVKSLVPDSSVTGLLAAGGFAFYPESPVIHACLLLIATICWCDVSKKVPSPRGWIWLAALACCALLVSSLPNWGVTVGFAISQMKTGTTQIPWWTYFDSYWNGLHGGVPTPAGHIRPFANLVLSFVGMYFAAPDCSLPILLRFAWIVLSVFGAGLVLYSIGMTLIRRFRNNATSAFVKAVMSTGFLLIFYFYEIGALWSLGKLLSFLSPYLFLTFCIAFLESTEEVAPRSLAIFPTPNRMISGVAVVFVISQLSFGGARLWYAQDPNGIGFNNASYPSIQKPAMKTTQLWDVDPDDYADCKGVALAAGIDLFYMEYIKQKLLYRAIPYYSSLPVHTHYAVGEEVGRQPALFTDCEASWLKGQAGKWHAVRGGHHIGTGGQ
ncbi:MAG: hypothetical protein JWR22_529 [Herminiimonas sp.]|nr:hypothetical protein [Herminiimonas sp.]